MDKKELRSTIVDNLQNLAYENKITPEVIIEILEHFDRVSDERERDLVRVLSEKISSWEDIVGDEDKSLYTLGVRHAIDLIRGSDPKKPSDYQPLDDDYRPK